MMLRIVLEDRCVHPSLQKLHPLAFEERIRPGLRARVHRKLQSTLPPALFDDPVNFIYGGTNGDPMSNRRAEEGREVKRQPVITNTYDYVVLSLPAERLVPHVFQQAAGPRHSGRTPIGARGTRTRLARDLVQSAPRHRRHAAGRSHKAGAVSALHKYGSEIE